MTVDERRRPAVGAQVKRWRTERGLTLANVAERSGLNVGYLSQIENDKASPSLGCLASLGEALDVPIAWFFMGETPPPFVVRAADRPVERVGHGSRGARGRPRVTRHLDPRGDRRPDRAAGSACTATRGDEHHLVLRGRFRLRQGDHDVEARARRLRPLGRVDPP